MKCLAEQYGWCFITNVSSFMFPLSLDMPSLVYKWISAKFIMESHRQCFGWQLEDQIVLF